MRTHPSTSKRRIYDVAQYQLEALERRLLLVHSTALLQSLPTFPVGQQPRSIAVADVNHDGSPDIVVANTGESTGGNTVSVLLSNGNGTYQPQRTFLTGTYPISVAIADLNGDGRPDLVVANNKSSYSTGASVSVLLGNGNGTFQPQHTYSTGFGPQSVILADVSGDGKLDIVLADSGVLGTGPKPGFCVLLGNGNGTFGPDQTYSSGTGWSVVSLAVADVDSDGKPDIILGSGRPNGSGILTVFLGSAGFFQSPQTFTCDDWPVAIAAADVNGDGKPDLIACGEYYNRVCELLGNGNGSFQVQQTFAVGLTPRSSVIATDLNGDGIADVIVANSGSNDLSVLLSNGNGTFRPAQNFLAGTKPFAIAAADINGDGKLDVTIADYSGGAYGNGLAAVLVGNGNGTFQFRQVAVMTLPSAIGAADVNGDGRTDLIVGNIGNAYQKSSISLLLGNGDGTFQSQQTFTTVFSPESIAVADFNGDGRPDLAVADYGGADVGISLGNGNGTFQAMETFATFDSKPDSIVTADVNGDGILDLVLACKDYSNDNVNVLLGYGNGTFRPYGAFAGGKLPLGLGVSDLNGDGKPDLVVADGGNSGTVAVLLGNGNGTFLADRTISLGAASLSVAVSDVNGDGVPDIVTATNSVAVGVLLGNGDGTFRAPQTFTAGFPSSIVVSDLNGDGKPDALVTNPSGTVSAMLGNGDGTFQAPQIFIAGQNPRGMVLADLNGDGTPDVAVTNYFGTQKGITATMSVLVGNIQNSDTLSATSAVDDITIRRDADGTDIDWSFAGGSGWLAVTDPNGLTINGNGGKDLITLNYANGNPLPAILHLKGTFNLSGLAVSNPLANTVLEIGRSTVYFGYSSSDPLSLIQGYLRKGYNNGAWNGSATAGTGAITSAAAASNAAQTTAIGYADSADRLIAGQPTNTIELKYTLYGDTGLTGSVGFNDFTRLTQHYGQTTGGAWDTGDFNYDGSVNSADFTLMTRTYNTSIGNQALPAVAAPPASSGQAGLGSSSTPVSKPLVIQVTSAPTPAHRSAAVKHFKRRFR